MRTNTTTKTNLTIGRLAKEAGVGVETIRFYERKGLISKPPKPGAGFRRYPLEVARRIRFIKRAQELGFTLKEIKDILGLQVSGKSTCADLKKKADAKIAEVASKIEDLKHIKTSLSRFSRACGGTNLTIKECGILECFETDWTCQKRRNS